MMLGDCLWHVYATAHVRLRREPETGGLFADPFEPQRPGRNVPAGALRLGIMYADGRRAATTGEPALPADDPKCLILQPAQRAVILWPDEPATLWPMAAADEGLPRNIGAPATRALTAAGYTELRQLANVPVAELKKLHGVGPKALRLLQEALEQQDLSLG